MTSIILRYRLALVIGIHLALTVLANYLAFYLRFEGVIPAREMALFLRMLPWLVAIRGLLFLPFRVYEGLWRYTGIWDLNNIILSGISSTIVFAGLVRWVFGITLYPRSIYVVDTMALILFLGGIRLARRLYRERGHGKRERRVLIIGAGDAGEMIVRDMKNNPFYEAEPTGFVDDNPAKVGHTIHGVRVLGTREDLPRIMQEARPHEVLMAIPRADPAQMRGLVKSLEPYRIPIRTLPNLRDVLDGKVTVNQIRPLGLEDLLTRAPVGLDLESVRHLLIGKRVLVTGAGGSIGSELCRQISALAPNVLILYERYENGLHAVLNELARCDGKLICRPTIGDITDASRLDAVMAEYRPQIIFHAAAHKHVPLMELNPCEAVKNNVTGTRLVMEAAARFQAERFILISTDKAVNPSSVMGATKRVAELLVQEVNGRSGTRYVAVRFGNVLGSNGSVVPLFMEQIKAGKPVTVTHPEVQRYFMLIPEAVQLVLHAAAMGTGGEMYVLEMGEPIKVLEVARTLIRLSGFVPGEEIPIEFIGLRPGEKLVEELVGVGETSETTKVEKILRVHPATAPPSNWLKEQVSFLERLAAEGNVAHVMAQLTRVVPTFRLPEQKSSAASHLCCDRLVH